MSLRDPLPRFEVCRTPSTGYRWLWRYRAANNRIVAKSAGLFESSTAARRSIMSMFFFITERGGGGVDVITFFAEKPD